MTITVTTADAAENLDRAGGRVMRLLVDADATGQRLSALACEAPAGEAGPPLHVHPGTDELFLVQGGTLLLYADGATHRLGAGDAAFVPRGTAHTFATGPGERGPVRDRAHAGRVRADASRHLPGRTGGRAGVRPRGDHADRGAARLVLRRAAAAAQRGARPAAGRGARGPG